MNYNRKDWAENANHLIIKHTCNRCGLSLEATETSHNQLRGDRSTAIARLAAIQDECIRQPNRND